MGHLTTSRTTGTTRTPKPQVPEAEAELTSVEPSPPNMPVWADLGDSLQSTGCQENPHQGFVFKDHLFTHILFKIKFCRQWLKVSWCFPPTRVPSPVFFLRLLDENKARSRWKRTWVALAWVAEVPGASRAVTRARTLRASAVAADNGSWQDPDL